MAKVTTCRLCQGKLKLVLPLGVQPLVNHFPTKKEAGHEKKYPLNFCVCQKCGLGQIDYIVAPEKIFKSYDYLSQASRPLVDHLQKLAKDCQKEFKLSAKSKVLDIGANDGTLLSFFENSVTLGIEPAANIKKNKTIQIISDFFNLKLAHKIEKSKGQFDLIFVTHTLANIVDLHDFMKGIKLILAPKGILVIEVGSQKEMLTRGQFDAIYHEHYSYFSFQTLQRLLAGHGLSIFRAKKNSFHGGSLRVFATHASLSAKKVTTNEKILASDYRKFVKSTEIFRQKIQKLFQKIEDSKIAGYGAPGKGVTLLNYCGIDNSKISFIVDSTEAKQGKFMPGTRIPIYKEDYLATHRPDYLLLLAWNYKREILKKLMKQKIHAKIVIPFPKLKIVKVG